MKTRTTATNRSARPGSVKWLLRKIFPRTMESIAQEEADIICHYIANGNGLEFEANGDLVIIGLVRVIPASERRRQ